MNSEEYILLKRLRDSDTEALDLLYLHYAPKVRDFAFRLLRDKTEAEDITHDIFLRIWEQRATVGNILSFKSYLFRMTRNAVFNAFKRRQVRSRYRSERAAGTEGGGNCRCTGRGARVDGGPVGDDRSGYQKYA